MSEKIRIFLFVLMFVLVGLLPWWISIIFLFILTVYIPFYPEVIFFGFVVDMLFSPSKTFLPAGLVLATIGYVIINLVRTRVRT